MGRNPKVVNLFQRCPLFAEQGGGVNLPPPHGRRDQNRSLMHAGVLMTVTQLRERFWVPKGRKVVRAVIKQCVQCENLTSKNLNPNPALLPPDRVQRNETFEITAEELTGPFSQRGGSKA
ncbi:hypothetical protein AVEN_46373-1 [Araneus ventricosus]|uniref:Integrase zinc-binding domain-containing protein n=1 Tax=Araneus ventricosus TaxID=182803 RepID=A0A4Y2JN19_ARAVE|nr:hypothetical protein AVEN_46373-1 [Araneus ventricosus]